MSSEKHINGSKIQALRASAGLSLQGLSAYVDNLIELGADLEPVSKDTIRNIERGTVKDPAYQVVRSIARALEADPDTLYKEVVVGKKSRRSTPARRKSEPAQAARPVGADS